VTSAGRDRAPRSHPTPAIAAVDPHVPATAPLPALSPATPIFPEVARLELDELLVQLVDRAQDVMATRDRLNGLLHATRLVAAELALPVVIRQIVESARDLVQATYAALGVIGADGELCQFVNAGMSAADARDVGDLPRGRGILGVLIKDPRPLRLGDLHAHAAASGFPPYHPPMRSFLGVPIRIRDEVYGNLYLTDKVGGGAFTAEDEELVTALAITAGVAIENARLFGELSRRQRWQEASARITSALLSPDSPEPLAVVMDEGRRLVAADGVALTAPGEQNQARAGLVLTVPLALRGLTQASDASVANGSVADASVVALTVTREQDREPFTASDLDLLTHFGEQAALALELGQARADAERVLVLEDRDRIARDMHDHVIGRLFAAGMSAHGLTRWISDPAGRRKLSSHVDDLDAVIRDIRTSIFALDHDPVLAWGLPARVQQIVSEAVGHLGFAPTVHLDSGVDVPAGSLTERNLLAVLREALANVARHAGARSVEVTLTGGASLDLTVEDDGTGLPEHRPAPTLSGGHGLANMAERATTIGGTFCVTSREEGGTRMHWSVPADGP
jgi:two-component system, NarL family, sensor histidine kinase DevS